LRRIAIIAQHLMTRAIPAEEDPTEILKGAESILEGLRLDTAEIGQIEDLPAVSAVPEAVCYTREPELPEGAVVALDRMRRLRLVESALLRWAGGWVGQDAPGPDAEAVVGWVDQIRFLKPLTGSEQPALAPVFIPGCSGTSADYSCSVEAFSQAVENVIDKRFLEPGLRH
jgi:hypothetical protein